MGMPGVTKTSQFREAPFFVSLGNLKTLSG